MTSAAKVWPLPEVLDPGEEPFQIKESPHKSVVCTDLNARLMFVPSADDAGGRMSRLHEMCHVAITPKDGMKQAEDLGVGAEYINVAEDMRLGLFMHHNRFEIEESLPTELLELRAKTWVYEKDLKTATLMSVAMMGLPEYKTLQGFFPPEWQTILETITYECSSIMSEGGRQFYGSLEVARYLQRFFESSVVKQGEATEDDLVTAAYRATGDEIDNQWGEMSIATPPLRIPLLARRLVRRIKPKDHGENVMFPSRVDDDEKIFGSHRRVVKGTVLIDVSGSMHLSAEDVKEMVNAIPGLTVATYSGDVNTGTLTIIAKRGSMADMSDMYFEGGNVVDGPALRWLATQTEPRIWVCDGAVTGISDMSAPNLDIEARKIVAANKIRRVERPEEVVTAIKK